MKTITFHRYLFVLVFVIGTSVPILSSDYFVESLTSITKKATISTGGTQNKYTHFESAFFLHRK
jgi:hypothetical protein